MNKSKPDLGRDIPAVEELGTQLVKLSLLVKKPDRMRRKGFAEGPNIGTDCRYSEKTWQYCKEG